MGSYFLGCTAINWMTKSEQQGKLLINLVKLNIFYDQKC